MTKRRPEDRKQHADREEPESGSRAASGDDGERVEVRINGSKAASGAAQERSAGQDEGKTVGEGRGESATAAAARGEDAGPASGAAEDAERSETGEPPTPEQRIAEAEAKAAESYDRYLRSQAELENLRKRHQRELADRTRYEGELLLRDLLGVIDDLERALEHADGPSGGIREGVELVYNSLLSTLAKHGLERVGAEGATFDPAVHDAVAMVETAEMPPNTVVQSHRAGYRLRDRLLRPAMVVVSKSPGGGSENGENP